MIIVTLMLTHIHAYSQNVLLLVLQTVLLFEAVSAAFSGSVCTLCLEDFWFCFAFFPGLDTWVSKTDVEPVHSVRHRWMVRYRVIVDQHLVSR